MGGDTAAIANTREGVAGAYQLVSGLFLRLLALVYLVAFVSLGLQITGLAGADGILPFSAQLQHLEAEYGAERFLVSPNLFWFSASDLALQGVAIAGAVFSVLLFFNILQRLSLVLLFICYLSLYHAGLPFTNFQWDYLLLESGFLAIFLPYGSGITIFLFRWLLFRLRFQSGISKLLSGDPSWSNLTALESYFETQPLPHWVSWYAHHLPEWLLRTGTGAVLFIEIVVPFMMFLPGKARLFAAWATILLQVVILLTSNHNFFNILTIFLCLFLFTDRQLQRLIPAPAGRWLSGGIGAGSSVRGRYQAAMAALAGLIVLVSAFQMWEMVSRQRSPEPAQSVLEQLQPFHIVHKYHVFPTMKTDRKEIIIEGSDDAIEWRPYVFRYKPGYTRLRPAVVIPHQPRLDWMMWFLPEGHPLNMMWYEKLLERLLENSPSVTGLFELNPFPDQPPAYIRSSLYQYRFTSQQERAETGQWWSADYLGPFFPWPWMGRDTSSEKHVE